MDDIFLGRQPILDQKQELVAFELLFRSQAEGPAIITDGSTATASVIVNAFGEIGIQSALGPYRAFINLDTEFLMSDLVQALPRTRVVLEVLESVEPSDEVLARCAALRQQGFSLALDDVNSMSERVKRFAPVANMIKVDLMQVSAERLPALVSSFRFWPALLVAEKVDSREQLVRCQSLGFELFQGFYFAKPEVLTRKRMDSGKLALLRLLSLVLGDAETPQIEEQLKHHPGLTLNFMRIVNSAASGLSRKVASLREGIMVLGQRQLQRWVQLLLYTTGRSGKQMVTPLMHLAATRGRLMEVLAHKEHPRDKPYAEKAFMTGILSLMDTLMGLPMEQILQEVHLADYLQEALLNRAGKLGRLLRLVELKEGSDFPTILVLLAETPFITLKELASAELEALTWATGLSTEISA